MTDLTGKWSLVTGASRGIGRQVAHGLAKLGTNVIVHSRSLEHTTSLVRELRGLGVLAEAVEAELSDQAQVDRMLDRAVEIANIDVLVNNAAVQSKFFNNPYEASAAEYRRLFEINCIAPFRIVYRLLPPMVERGFGRIVNVTSGIANQPQLMPYAASKAAVDKFTKDFATTLEGTGVQMNVLDPGWLRTDLGGPHAPGQVESVLPGALVPILLDNGANGRWFSAQDFTGLTVEEAVAKAA